MKLKVMIMAGALFSLGAATIVPPPIAAYEAEAKKKKKKKGKKRSGNRNRSRSDATRRARTSGRNAANRAAEAARNQTRADGTRLAAPARDLMSRSAGDRSGFRDISNSKAVYPGSTREASPTRQARQPRQGASTRLETSSVSSSSTASTVLTRQRMPES